MLYVRRQMDSDSDVETAYAELAQLRQQITLEPIAGFAATSGGWPSARLMAQRYSDSQGQHLRRSARPVYLAPLGDAGQMYWLCVSNNLRNRALGEFLAVGLTTSPKPALPSIVELTAADRPLAGRVVCDDLGPIYPDDVDADVGALTTWAMRRVDVGLRAALALG